ncbi:MAG: glycosyltransferase family 2 protein [Candidatus Woesebacteria bacterium]|nr:glycosyltransferase family 2 protein [Candidatus Woesebacteria bacterium]
MKNKKIIAIFIAYNVANSLEKFWKNLPKTYFDECILVDDGSKDQTYKIAKKINGLKVYKNPINLGYGGNLKRAISLALNDGADIIVDIHPDGEYKPNAIPLALSKIKNNNYEFIMGNRFTTKDKPFKSGMYFWKIIPLLFLSFIDRLVLGIKINDLHQGFRVYTKTLFEKININNNSDDYLFSFEIIAQAVFVKAKIGEVPVETNYVGRKRGASFKSSLKYSLGTFKVLVLFILAKIGFKNKINNFKSSCR